jgi:molybdate transport system ATP-binding protein
MTLSVAIGKRLSPHFELDVAFTAPPGITILFGASGSGKSTVLRAVAGLLRPDRGRIATGNRVLFDTTAAIDMPARHRRIGYVFQQLALFPHMSIADNIAYGLPEMPASERRQRVAAIAGSFRISGTLGRRPAQASGGERQRAALARALVTEPAVLLLDEPLSGLDQPMQSLIIEDLRRWNDAHGIPVLYVTHAHREVFALGERVVVLQDGHVLASGSPQQVLRQPEHELVASLAGFENVFDGIVLARRIAGGTMECRLGIGTVDIEVPLTSAAVGSRIRVAIRAGDILIANQEPRGVSARNVLRGVLTSIAQEGATTIATVDAGERFVVHLTPGGYASLGLSPGMVLWLIVKTYSCHLLAGDTIRADSPPPVAGQ